MGHKKTHVLSFVALFFLLTGKAGRFLVEDLLERPPSVGLRLVVFC